MSAKYELISEYIVLVLDIIRRRWLLFCLPVAIAIPIAVLAVYVAPKKFVTKSLILLQAANRGANAAYGGGMQRQAAMEQVATLEAWLKSDQVLTGILPQLFDNRPMKSPTEIFARMNIIRASLSLELVGGSVLEMRLEGREPKGLGKNLEIIISRLMEGLTGPEQGIFSASQFLLLRRSEAATAAEAALDKAIHDFNMKNPELIKRQLKQLYDYQQQGDARSMRAPYPDAPGPGPAPGLPLPKPSDKPFSANDGPDTFDRGADILNIRRTISTDPAVTQELEHLYEAWEAATAAYEDLKERARTGGSNNYVGIFDSPENLLVIGRPEDPIVGESAARKVALAGVMLSVLGVSALVVLLEMLSTRIRLRSEFESIAGIPVVSRIPRARLRAA